MTAVNVNNATPWTQQIPAAAATAITVPFLFYNATDLLVYKGSSSTPLTYATDYSVAGAGAANGGTVTLITSAGDGVTAYTVQRSSSVQRTSQYPSSGPFSPDSLNTDLGQITTWVQETQLLLERSLQLAPTDPQTSGVLPAAAARANMYLAFDASGALIATPAPAAGGTVISAAMLPTVQAASVAAARTDLGLGSAAVLTAGTAANNAVQLDASAKLPAVDGSQLTAITKPALPGAAGLKIVNDGTTPNTKLSVTATAAVMVNSSGVAFYAAGLALSIDCTTTGAAGMDTGALANSTWYYVWLISNGTLTRGLVSLSSTAPTLPNGYTYEARIGAFKTDGSAHFLRMLQLNRRTQFTAGMGLLASGAAGSTTTPTWVAVAVSGFAPPTATRVFGSIAAASSQNAIVAPNNTYGTYTSTTDPPYVLVNNGTAYQLQQYDMALESANIYWASSASTGLLFIAGYEDGI